MSTAEPLADVLAHPAARAVPARRGPAVSSLAKHVVVSTTAAAMTPVGLGIELLLLGADRGGRLAERTSTLLRELRVTARATQRVLLALAEAIDEGFLEEVRGGLRTISSAVELMATVSEQLDQALPVLDATTPTLRVMNSTLDQLNGTIAQLDALPGVRMARRFVMRPPGPELA